MPKGPKGEKRPADVIGNAVKVMRIATGEELDEPFTHASTLKRAAAKKGGISRAQKLDKKRLSEIAVKAAAKRWGQN